MKKTRASATVEGREQQLVGLAVDLAEQQLREGTAKAQVIVHYLKLGTTIAEQEKELLQEQIKLMKAKTDALASQKTTEQLYASALEAMRSYNGHQLTDEESIDE